MPIAETEPFPLMGSLTRHRFRSETGDAKRSETAADRRNMTCLNAGGPKAGTQPAASSSLTTFRGDVRSVRASLAPEICPSRNRSTSARRIDHRPASRREGIAEARMS